MSIPRPIGPGAAHHTVHAADQARLERPAPEPLEGIPLLNHPDVQVTEQGEGYYRIRVGAVELTYDCSSGHGAWYLYLPGHRKTVGPVTTDQYAPQQDCMININRDQRGQAVGIEVV